MDSYPKKIIFIVGVCAPASLYVDYINDLKRCFPDASVSMLQWWDQLDFGLAALKSEMGKSEVMLIAHSAGGTLALIALKNRPDLVKKIVFLDSHFFRSTSLLPFIDIMLDKILAKNTLTMPEVETRVRAAYAPIVKNDIDFKKALGFAVDWVNKEFDRACRVLSRMPANTGLYIGSSNKSYQLLTEKDKNDLRDLWGKYQVDVEFMLGNHFDLIDAKVAAEINQRIVTWLNAHG